MTDTPAIALKGHFLEATTPDGTTWVIPFWNPDVEAMEKSLTEKNQRANNGDIIPKNFDDGYTLYLDVREKTPDAIIEHLEDNLGIRVHRKTLVDLEDLSGVKGVFKVTAYMPTDKLPLVSLSPLVGAIRPMCEGAKVWTSIAQAIVAPK
jgi:hypothetical protein